MRKFKIINSPASGTWHRDAVLIESKKVEDALILTIDKESDKTRYMLTFQGVSLHHVWDEEKLPDWLVFEPPKWGSDFYEVEGDDQRGKKQGKKHYIYFTYDEIFEVFADSFSVEELGPGEEV